MVDEGNPDGGASCGATAGACEAGALTCARGGFADDGLAFATDVNHCGSCGHVCSLPNAIERCVAGACGVAACEPGFRDLDPLAPGCEYACDFVGAEVCNGRDDDCDGAIDEGVARPSGFCSPNGVCAGTLASCGGAAGWVCTYPATYEEAETRCDGLDNDCDGLADEGYPLLGAGCFNGLGACRRDGLYVCDPSTRDRVLCNAPPAGAPASEVCNGLDDDCDGRADEREPNDPLTPCATGSI